MGGGRLTDEGAFFTRALVAICEAIKRLSQAEYLLPARLTSALARFGVAHCNRRRRSQPMTAARRLSIRFSLRSLLLLVLAMSVSLAWIIQQARQQAVAVSALRNMGIEWRVEYADSRTLNVSEMLRKWCGEKPFRDVVRLSVDTSRPTDAGLNQLRFGPRYVNDAALTHLRSLAQLEVLELHGAQVDDAWLAHLGGLTRLKQLRLDCTNVTDDGLIHLYGLKRLGTLSLMSTLVTDAGAAELQERFRHQGTLVHYCPRSAHEESELEPGCVLVIPDSVLNGYELPDDDSEAELQYMRSVPQPTFDVLSDVLTPWGTTLEEESAGKQSNGK